MDKHTGEETRKIILANKSDMSEEREVYAEDMRRFEEKYGLSIIDTSAKTGENVDESFLKITRELMVIKDKNTGKPEPDRITRITNTFTGNSGEGNCCAG